MVAAAVIGGAVIGGVATGVAGSKAAGAQRDAATLANNTQERQYNQTRTDLAPYREAGYTALGQLGKGLEDGGDFNRDFTMADFQADPGRQFRFDTGEKAIQASAAARGGLLNGGTLKALTRYGQDYGSQEYSNAYQRFNNDRNQRFGRLAQVAGVGQGATNTTSQIGAQTADQISANQTGVGNSIAANYVNQGNAVNNTVGSLGQFYLQNQYLNKIPNVVKP